MEAEPFFSGDVWVGDSKVVEGEVDPLTLASVDEPWSVGSSASCFLGDDICDES